MNIYILEEAWEDTFSNCYNTNILAASTDIDNIIKSLPQYIDECKIRLDEMYDDCFEEDNDFCSHLHLFVYNNPDDSTEYDFKNIYTTQRGFNYEYSSISNDLYELIDKKELSMLFSLKGYKLESFNYERDEVL